MIRENIKHTLELINEGFIATNEAEILPIYYGNELANRAAYRACQFKRFINSAREHAGQIAVQTAHVATVIAQHTAADFPGW